MNWLREPDAEPIPGYKLISPLGSGGFGEVWKCVAPGGIHKAIKFVFGNLNSLDGDSAKAEQEFKALERVKSVRHPFVVSMDRIEVVAGELLIVMELADKSLHDVYEEYRKKGLPGIPREELLAFLTDAAEGLDHMIEKHSLQHLDIKPKNLFVIADRVKVADFGLVRDLAKQSSAGMMGGISPVYAAPETFANKVSKHSDQYSLAIVYVEVARRAGIPLEGVAFPGHFLVKHTGVMPALIIDVFAGGAILSDDDCQALLGSVHGPEAVFHRSQLRSADRSGIVARVLRNLKAAYLREEDFRRALGVAQCLIDLEPDKAFEWRDRALVRLRLDDTHGALADFERYLDLVNVDVDVEEVENAVAALRRLHAKMN